MTTATCSACGTAAMHGETRPERADLLENASGVERRSRRSLRIPRGTWRGVPPLPAFFVASIQGK